ncbi:MAG: dihydroneopterin aldolase [Muribaculaceae bacterium]|nr:dihydroneopterin aldolase [Muribaculaceae bacterium]
MPEFEIQLRDVLLYGYHGVLPEENKLGNQYRLNVRLHVDASAFDPDRCDLSSTISYAEVYDIVAAEMRNRAALLESVAVRIAGRIRARWPHTSDAPYVKSGEIEIVKLVPPIPGMIGEAGVKYSF